MVRKTVEYLIVFLSNRLNLYFTSHIQACYGVNISKVVPPISIAVSVLLSCSHVKSKVIPLQAGWGTESG